MKFQINSMMMAAALFCGVGIAAGEVSPWGIAAHPLRQAEWNNLDQEIALCKQAGMTWMRNDIRYTNDSSNLSRHDVVIEKLAAAGITYLPILEAYDWEIEKIHPEVTPMWKHPEAWRKFVRDTAMRYRGKLKVWEIWNEQDGGFWRPAPNAAQYVPLLQIAYEELKKADPENQVIVGGLCGWNTAYLESMYAVGAKGYFDAIAVHPYGEGPDRSGYQANKMAEFKALMAKNGDADKKLWITEFGASTNRNRLMEQEPEAVVKAMRFAAEKINRPLPAGRKPVVGTPLDRNGAESLVTGFNYLPGAEIRPITAGELATVSVEELPFMIAAHGEALEESFRQPMLDYLRRGGIVMSFAKVPFYYINSLDSNGRYTRKNADPALHEELRYGFEAWWTRKGLPESTTRVRVSDAAKAIGFKPINEAYATRFLSTRNVKSDAGDAFYPVLEAYQPDGQVLAPVMGVYTYGDRAGALLTGTIEVNTGLTEEQLADLLPRLYLSYLASGVENLFLYDLHNDGSNRFEREHNFGLLNEDFSPKAGYHAYQAMTAALGKNPKFSVRLKSVPSIWALVFQRDDGKSVLAVWSAEPGEAYQVTLQGKNVLTGVGTPVRFLPMTAAPDAYQISPVSGK